MNYVWEKINFYENAKMLDIQVMLLQLNTSVLDFCHLYLQIITKSHYQKFFSEKKILHRAVKDLRYLIGCRRVFWLVDRSDCESQSEKRQYGQLLRWWWRRIESWSCELISSIHFVDIIPVLISIWGIYSPCLVVVFLYYYSSTVSPALRY